MKSASLLVKTLKCTILLCLLKLTFSLEFETITPQIKEALPGEYVSYVWKITAKESGVLELKLASPLGWNIPSVKERKATINPDKALFVPVTVQVPLEAKEGLYEQSLRLNIAGKDFYVPTKVNFKAGFTLHASQEVSFLERSTLWPVKITNLGNGDDSFRFEILSSEDVSSRQISLEPGEARTVRFNLPRIGTYTFEVSSLRDSKIKKQFRVKVVSQTLPRGLNEEFKLTANVNTFATLPITSSGHEELNFGLHGPLSDFVNTNMQFQLNNDQILRGSLHLDGNTGLDKNWFAQSFFNSDLFRFSGGYSDRHFTFSAGSEAPSLESFLSLSLSLPEQQIITGATLNYTGLEKNDDSILSTAYINHSLNDSLTWSADVSWREDHLVASASSNYHNGNFNAGFALTGKQLLTNPETDFSLKAAYDKISGRFKLNPFADEDSSLWRGQLQARLSYVNTRLEIDEQDGLAFSAFKTVELLPNFDLEVDGRIEYQYDQSWRALLELDTHANKKVGYRFLPFFSLQSDDLEQMLFGLKFALPEPNVSGLISLTPLETSFEAGIESEYQFDLAFAKARLDYKWQEGLNDLGALLSVNYPWQISKETSLLMLAEAGLDYQFETSNGAGSAITFDQENPQINLRLGISLNTTLDVPTALSEVFGGKRVGYLEGKVIVEGASIPEGLVVEAGDYSTKVEADGYFKLALPVGNYIVSINPKHIPFGFILIQDKINVEIEHKEIVSTVFNLSATAEVHGSAESTSNAPPQPIPLRLFNEEGQSFNITSNVQGQFSVKGLEPATYRLVPILPKDWQSEPKEMTFSLAAAEILEVNFKLTPPVEKRQLFDPTLMRIRRAELETKTVPKGSRPILTVQVRGEAVSVEVSYQENILGVLKKDDELWQGRVSIPLQAENSLLMRVIARDQQGNEATFPLLLTSSDSASWGNVTYPRAVLSEAKIPVTVHWLSDEIVSSHINLEDEQFDLQPLILESETSGEKQNSGYADWQGNFLVPKVNEQARLLFKVIGKFSDGREVLLEQIIVVQPQE